MQDSTEPARPDRRWVVLLIVTIIIQVGCALLAPQFVYIHRLQRTTWGIILIPVLWSLVLLVIRRGLAERLIAYGAFLVAVTVAFLGIWSTL